MTLADLDKQDTLKHLLDAPAPYVVGQLIDELRRYIAFVEELKSRSYQSDIINGITIDYLLRKHKI